MEIFQRNKERGFTMIELMVVAALFAIVATIGVGQFRTSHAHGELVRAASRLESDIRWMQQLSANNQDFPTPVDQEIKYRYRVHLEGNVYKVQLIEPDSNTGLDKITDLKEVNFIDDKVNARIIRPVEGAINVNITYYAYDLDRLKKDSATLLENCSYQIQLKHTATNEEIFVNVDSRVGRVWTNIDGTNLL